MSSLKIQVTDGSQHAGNTADQELFFARRALALIKDRLGNDGMLHLLTPDIDAADAWWEKQVRESKGQFRLVTITVRTVGLIAEDLLGWYAAHHDQMPLMQAAHPEHYVYGVGPILETIGEHPTHITLEITKEPHFCVTVRDEAKYPIALTATAKLRNGTVIGHACHQFRNFAQGEERGFVACFAGFIPAACSDEVVETHRQHFQVEWSNWITAAYNHKYGN